MTVHDVTFMHLATFGRVTTFAMREIVTRASRTADALATGSAAARDDLAATLGIPAEQFTVIHHGIDRRETPQPADPAAVRARLDLPERDPILVCVATKRPHKNQELLLRALGSVPDAVVVLAGHPEQPYDQELRTLADSLGIASRVRFADYVPDAELEALWRMAAVAVFPTRAEGFGIPVAEALAHGVPVACSDIAVLHEVGGPFVRTFDPDDVAGCAAAIRLCLSEPFDSVAARSHAASFTWAAAAERYWQLYEQVMAG